MLKLIHTSDWHLGATLHEIDRHAEHLAFLDWLLECLNAEQADALVVAGDVFDSANPPAEALRLLCAFLGAARARLPRLQTILTGGNHDSALRLEAPRELFALAGARVVGAWPWLGAGWDRERLCIPLQDKHQKTAAWLGAVPFMRPGDLYRAMSEEKVMGNDYEHEHEHEEDRLKPENQATNNKQQTTNNEQESHSAFDQSAIQGRRPSEPSGPQSTISEGVARLYGAAAAALRECRQDGEAIILTGHLYASGGQLSPDSERLIQRGNLESIPADVFPEDAAYVALGHLHLAQRVGGAEHIRYSGSPLPLSFSEVDYRHQVLVVTLEGPRCAEARPVIVPRFRELRRIPAAGPGEKSAVLTALLEFASAAEGEGSDRQRWPLLEARVRLAGPDPQLRREVEEALRNRAAVLARLEASFARPDAGDGGEGRHEAEHLETIRPEEVFLGKWRDDFGGEPGAAVRQAFLEVLEAVQHGADQ